MHSAATNSGTNGLNISHVRLALGWTKLAAATSRGVLILAVLSTLPLIAARSAQAQTESLLHDFTGGSDGGEPQGHLIADGAGNFYGTTDIGGLGYGTVFELSPNGSGGWNETVLHTFTDWLDGGYPFFTSLIFDSLGNLYGTTYGGGPTGHGVVFELSPVGTRWEETVLYSFGRNGSTGGDDPFNGVIMDSAGNLYGTIADPLGVFELSPSSGGWKETRIYSFGEGVDDNGGGGITMDASGNIFGVLSPADGIPAVFELSPNRDGGWTPTVLHTFAKNIFPEGAPVLDKAGNLYGTTMAGGAHNMGTVYELSPGDNAQWTEKILYSFKGSKTEGSGPYAGIVFDAAGNIYGTTTFGGQSDAGTVFELAPVGKDSYQEKVLWIFDGTNGSGSLASLILDSTGKLYGVTPSGGGTGCSPPVGCGIAFEVTP